MADPDRASTPGGSDPRPRPQYGEYAPQDPSLGTSGDPAGAAGGAVTPSAQSGSAARSAAPGSGPLPGVPHNLGVRGASPARPVAAPTAPSAQSSTPTQSSTQYPAPTQTSAQASSASTPQQAGAPEPYRAAPPHGIGAPQAYAGAPTGAPAGAPAAARSGADRISTILLLVLGALGALYLAGSLYQMPASLALAGSMLGADDLTVPQSVATIGSVGAIVVLSLYAVTLIASLRRLRARKLTFWLPLSAGVLALVIMFACTMIGVAQVPELLSLASDPDAASKLLGG